MQTYEAHEFQPGQLAPPVDLPPPEPPLEGGTPLATVDYSLAVASLNRLASDASEALSWVTRRFPKTA